MGEQLSMTQALRDICIRVLVVEDNRDICENIGDYFGGRGHITDFAHDGISAMHLALTEPVDVIVLDLMLPGMDGLTFCQKLRREAKSNTPVLMLTARDTLPDKLAGFDAGADDYLVKPFALEELHARVASLHRRSRTKTRQLLSVADLTMDIETLEVRRAGRRLFLNPACLKILERLMEASPAVVARADLETLLWRDDLPDSDALRSHLYTLRRAIDKPFDRPLLHTVHRIGYRLADDNVSA
jgi:DNA-binding response OmpR family regulator